MAYQPPSFWQLGWRALWRDAINSPAQSLIAAQLQIALRVRGGLAAAIGGAPTDAGEQPKNEEAYQLFLRSAALTVEPATNADAIAMLEKSVQLDPNYAQVREYLGEAYVIKGRPDLAREQLGVIEKLCGGTSCEEYEDLQAAIAGKDEG